MRNIMTYIQHNKWKVFATVIILGTVFFAFKTFENKTPELPEIRHRKLLSTIGHLLETEHYSPRKIDDEFSKEVFKGFIKVLDPEKNIFLQTDMNALTVYENTLDDEIHGADIKFEPAANALYEKRLSEVRKMALEILETPFDFNIDDSVLLDEDTRVFPKTEKDRYTNWYQILKYKALDRYSNLIEEREKNKNKEKYVVKTDATIESETRAAIKKEYTKRFDKLEKTTDKEKRFELYLNSITSLMDPHTDYFAPIEKRSFTESMSGTFYGIGAQLTQDDNGVKIASVQPGGAAWKSGQIVVNDVIIKIAQGSEEPVDVSGYETQDAVKLIRGDLGSEVRLTIRKMDGSIKVVTLIREKIILDEGFARSVVIQKGADKYGYILLPDFYADFDRADGPRCSKDVAKEIEKLKAEKVKGIAIDVRFNGGGSLYEVVQMAGLLIDQGPIVQIRNREGRSQTLSDETPGLLYDGPIVVMVNEFSASASEIFAGAIQDYKRGIIMGSTSTYGKGTVQRNVAFGKPLDDLGIQTEYGAVKLTFQKFYRVTGSSTQKKGVVPDVILPDDYEFLKYREKDNESALPWDETIRSKFQIWPNNAPVTAIAANANARIAKDTALNLFKKDLEWVSTQMDRPVYLKYDKYVAYRKKVQSVMQQNDNRLKLKENLVVAPMKADYDKFYNNPDKTKQDRYQAWLKMVAKDPQISEASKLLSEFPNPTWIAKKGS